MKNKRNVLIAFILICCLCLSIGYAALTDTLNVNGTVGVNVLSDDTTDDNDTPNDDTNDKTAWETDFDADVHFANASGVGAVINANDNDILTITVPTNAIKPNNRTVTYTVDIVNESTDYDANITLAQINANGDFVYDVKWTNGDAQPATIAKKTGDTDSSKNVTITITYNGSPTADVAAVSFNVDFSVAIPTT